MFDFRLSRVQNTPRILVPFLEGVIVNMCFLFLNFFMFQIHFAQYWRNFLGCFEGVEHATIFDALFPGCHGVGERVSLRGAVTKLVNSANINTFVP